MIREEWVERLAWDIAIRDGGSIHTARGIADIPYEQQKEDDANRNTRSNPLCIYCGVPTHSVLPVCDGCAADLLPPPLDIRKRMLIFVATTAILAVATWFLNPLYLLFKAATWLLG